MKTRFFGYSHYFLPAKKLYLRSSHTYMYNNVFLIGMNYLSGVVNENDFNVCGVF